MLQSRLIDLSDYKEEDLEIKGIKGGVLAITTEGNPSVTVKGKNGALDAEYTLAIVNLSDFSKSNSISGEGDFVAPIIGLDRVILEVSGSGKILLREMA